MKNEKQLIDAVIYITAVNHSFTTSKREKDLARFILKNYYDVCCFFLNEEDNYASGLNLKSVEMFSDKFEEIWATIQN